MFRLFIDALSVLYIPWKCTRISPNNKRVPNNKFILKCVLQELQIIHVSIMNSKYLPGSVQWRCCLFVC